MATLLFPGRSGTPNIKVPGFFLKQIEHQFHQTYQLWYCREAHVKHSGCFSCWLERLWNRLKSDVTSRTFLKKKVREAKTGTNVVSPKLFARSPKIEQIGLWGKRDKDAPKSQRKVRRKENPVWSARAGCAMKRTSEDKTYPDMIAGSEVFLKFFINFFKFQSINQSISFSLGAFPGWDFFLRQGVEQYSSSAREFFFWEPDSNANCNSAKKGKKGVTSQNGSHNWPGEKFSLVADC